MFENGQVKCRYSRYLADDGLRWVRHGAFEAFHQNGTTASIGDYEHGLEHGLWRDYHENGDLAAQGHYRDGVEIGIWKFWADDGTEEPRVNYGDSSTGPSERLHDPICS